MEAVVFVSSCLFFYILTKGVTGIFTSWYSLFKKLNPKTHETDINRKGTGGGGGGGCSSPTLGFLLITSKLESFSTENFVTFPNIKCTIRTK